jgi:hypothetical protein
MGKDLIIDILSERVVAFQRIFVRITGTINAALFLSQAMYWSGKSKSKTDWFYKTHSEWEEETGLTRCEQDNARKILRLKGILEEKKEGLPCKLWFKVNFDQIRFLANSIDFDKKNNEPDSGEPTDQLTGDQPTSCSADNNHSLSEITTEMTAEITAETATKIPENGNSEPEFKPAVSQKELNPLKQIPRILGYSPDNEKNWKEEIKKLSATYGGTKVCDAFQLWLDDQTGEIKYPISRFVKNASFLIQGVTITKKDSPTLQALLVSLYKIGNITLDRYRIQLDNLLKIYSFKEVEQAYKDFIVGKDEYDMKFAPKNFVEGAAETIIITNRQDLQRKQDMINSMNEKATKDRQEIEKQEVLEPIKEEL